MQYNFGWCLDVAGMKLDVWQMWSARMWADDKWVRTNEGWMPTASRPAPNEEQRQWSRSQDSLVPLLLLFWRCCFVSPIRFHELHQTQIVGSPSGDRWSCSSRLQPFISHNSLMFRFQLAEEYQFTILSDVAYWIASGDRCIGLGEGGRFRFMRDWWRIMMENGGYDCFFKILCVYFGSCRGWGRWLTSGGGNCCHAVL